MRYTGQAKVHPISLEAAGDRDNDPVCGSCKYIRAKVSYRFCYTFVPTLNQYFHQDKKYYADLAGSVASVYGWVEADGSIAKPGPFTLEQYFE